MSTRSRVLSVLLVHAILLTSGAHAAAQPVSAAYPVSDGPSEVWVDDDFDPATPGWGITHFDRVQDGVDAVAASGLVHIQAGLYVENIRIEKPIELAGEDQSTVLIDGGGIGKVVLILAGGDGTLIRDVTVRNSGTDHPSAGIMINGADGVTITDTLLENNYDGIHLTNSSNNEITFNEINDNGFTGIGVFCYGFSSNGNTISKNLIRHSARAGIMIHGTPGSDSYDNIITGNWIDSVQKLAGIYISGDGAFYTRNGVIEDNTVINSASNWGGYRLAGIDGSTVRRNIARGNFSGGFSISGSDCIVTDNLSEGNAGTGFSFGGLDLGTVARNRSIGDYYGLLISLSEGSVFEDNLFIECQYQGVHFAYAVDNVFQRNLIMDCEHLFSGDGIRISSQSRNNLFRDNTILNCGVDGIWSEASSGNRFLENIISGAENGITLDDGSSDALIHGNVIADNRAYGIDSHGWGIENNLIYHNAFIDNAGGNAYDTEITEWDAGYPEGGNYYSDYTGDDLDGDGIGDVSYPIPGGDNKDRYPLMAPPGGGALRSDTCVLSGGAGGSVQFTLDADETNAGRYYLLLGGLSGTEPGFPLPGGHATLPVNWDDHTDLLLANLNTPFFQGFLGLLQTDGTASATLLLPPLPPDMVGVRISLAFTCNNPYDVASNPMTIQIVE